MKSITIHNIDDHQTKPYQEFIDLQGDFKAYNEVQRLAERIKKVGFKYDFFTWECPEEVMHNEKTYPSGTCFIVDAHARQQALQLIESEGYTVPPVPYTRIQSESIEAAKQEILFLNSRYGVIMPDSDFLDENLKDLSLEIFETLHIPELEDIDDRETVFLEEDDGTEYVETEQGLSQYPLSVVLNKEQFEQWQEVKEQLGVKTDTLAVIRLMQGVKEDV